jgi:V8-like Glu-specific endopeptidase
MTRLPLLLALGLAAGLALPAAAQPVVPSRMEPVRVHSGEHAGAADSARLAFQHTVRVPGARWLRLRFDRYHLGEGSFLRLTALEDGGRQHLTASALEAWRRHSAYFNGDAVTVELFVGPGDEGAFFELVEAEVGLPAGEPETICGSADDRTASADAAVGRLRTPADGVCTGWLISSGAFLTAGHCTAVTVLEFNVPASDPDGTINVAPPEDQYAVNAFVFEAVPDPGNPPNTYPGQDWMVFSVAPNTETGLLPGEVQGAFYRISQDDSPASFRVTGYGSDMGVDNATQQTSTGTNEGETVEDPNWVLWEHRVDTQGGNSGSPIGLTGEPLAVGIHTHGGCTTDGGANSGTSFESDDLAAAIDGFFGTDVVHLDAGHPALLQLGTPLRPYKTLGLAVGGVPAGGTIRAVAGTYDEPAAVYTKAMEWLAPVGSVVVH